MLKYEGLTIPSNLDGTADLAVVVSAGSNDIAR